MKTRQSIDNLTVFGYNSSMGLMKKTSCLLLLFWVPMVNLGPSLHRADFFGFHSHCCRSDHHHNQPVGLLECGSGHRHCHSDGKASCPSLVANTDRQPPQRETNNPYYTGPDSTCSICKFFDEYNVVFDGAEASRQITRVYQRFASLNAAPTPPLQLATARGPPALFLGV